MKMRATTHTFSLSRGGLTGPQASGASRDPSLCPTILIVEDDKEIVEAVSLALVMRWPNAHIVSTHLGESGLALVKRLHPDVVLLDLGLADMDGFEVLQRVRRWSDVPVVILTVRSDDADVLEGRRRGANDYIVKPFRHSELVARVGALLPPAGRLGEHRLSS